MAGRQIRDTIRQQRFDNNEMTQQKLLKAVGATRKTISALESNRHSASLGLAFRIAHSSNVVLEEVFQYEIDTLRYS
ncbi:helix-turn-helix transcriptional regulator [Teredinibacter haidensis]|uniref:helix-turn-helix transcriptional regulator n=1 Tax=Teredinibacter haidensis TaxID=2731755 RepID=UPI00094907FE|nr:hypothetical protein [Teredinibacter haidensis]